MGYNKSPVCTGHFHAVLSVIVMQIASSFAFIAESTGAYNLVRIAALRWTAIKRSMLKTERGASAAQSDDTLLLVGAGLSCHGKCICLPFLPVNGSVCLLKVLACSNTFKSHL